MTIKAFVLDALGKFWTKLKGSYITPLQTNNIGMRKGFATGSSNNAIKVTSNAVSDEQYLYLYGVGIGTKTICCEVYFRGSNGSVVINNFGQIAVKAQQHGSETNTVVLTTGTYATGVILSRRSDITISYSTSSETVVTNSIESIGDGSVQGAISNLESRSIIIATTYESLYNQVINMSGRNIASICYLSGTCVGTITSSKIGTYCKGVMACMDVNNKIYDFIVMNGNQDIYSFRATFTSSTTVTLGTFRKMARETDVDALNAKAISYVDVSGTTGTSQYGSYYYVNIAIPVAARAGFISASILTSENYRYAVVQRTTDTQVRVYCDQSGKSVTVRIAYQ